MPWAACWVLLEISCVAAPCCSITAAMAVATSLTSMIVPRMPFIASIESCATFWTARICVEISSVALAVWLASIFTSDATTAKPLPASPARAASMVALSASRLVWAAMLLMRLTTSPILLAVSEKPLTRSSVC
ncbi:hypothetical protein BN961_00216 [Afipia felis]|uniref:Uncharacterized protein n=1 Tax=Afipia felis TaxID=1035 RepID=A0A090MGR2_AFIFE|nr:hypothetical protein BN961_00216 [Afipia felis]